MKKQTAILAIVIAFLAGFVTGATVAIVKGTKHAETVAKVEQPGPIERPAPSGPPPEEVASKIKVLKDVVKKDPGNLAAWVEMGNLYFDSGQPKEAVDAYSHYLAVKPENPDVRTDMGIMYRTLGNFDRALEEFRKAARSDPKHVNSRYNIGIVLLHDKGDVPGAIKAWEEYLKVDPKSERADRVRSQMENLKKMAKEAPEGRK